VSKLLVIGSINMDVVSSVKQFPLPGETIHSSGISYYPGGKGANQAVAAARAGARCEMVGAVGRDAFGGELVAALERSGADVSRVLRKEGNSGIALITVSEEGENSIILSEGANGGLTAADAAYEGDWSDVYAVLLQNEIAWPTTLAVISEANRAGARVWLNPAPARAIPDELLPSIDTLIMNETETAVITGMKVSDAQSARSAADRIIGKGTANVIITLGEQGCYYENAAGESCSVPAFRVQPVDTTAAGDTFIGAYAAACADGQATPQALKFAAAAAALAVTSAGAQSSIPSKAEIMAFMEVGAARE